MALGWIVPGKALCHSRASEICALPHMPAAATAEWGAHLLAVVGDLLESSCSALCMHLQWWWRWHRVGGCASGVHTCICTDGSVSADARCWQAWGCWPLCVH